MNLKYTCSELICIENGSSILAIILDAEKRLQITFALFFILIFWILWTLACTFVSILWLKVLIKSTKLTCHPKIWVLNQIKLLLFFLLFIYFFNSFDFYTFLLKSCLIVFKKISVWIEMNRCTMLSCIMWIKKVFQYLLHLLLTLLSSFFAQFSFFFVDFSLFLPMDFKKVHCTWLCSFSPLNFLFGTIFTFI